jgi:hypothetical protein
MKELYEFRVYTNYAPEVLGDERPRRSIRVAAAVVVRGVVGDERYRRIGELDRRFRTQGNEGSVFAGWQITRKYTVAEIRKAELFLLDLRYAHAAGDEYGTGYTDAPFNPDCGIGREEVKVDLHPFRVFREKTTDLRCALGSRQTGPLILPTKKQLKSRDIFMLWSGEIIVSARILDIIENSTGSLLQPVWSTMRGARSASSVGLSSFRQWVVRSRPLIVCDPTRFGDQPFRGESEQCKCPLGLGETRGAHLLSGLYIKRSSWDGSDACTTDVFVGTRRGLFRPYNPMVVSRRLFGALQKTGVRGVRFEIVELT